MSLPSALLGDITKRSKDLRAVPESSRRDRSAAIVDLLRKQESSIDESSAREYFFSSGVETWIDFVKEYTFTSSCCSITPEEARIIVKHWDEQSTNKADDEQFDPELLNETKLMLKGLRDRLSSIIDLEKAKSPSGRAFVKLSTRSPKDSRKLLAMAADSYRERITNNDGSKWESTDDNTRWKMLSEEVAKMSAVDNADAAMDFLLDSLRVKEDLDYALEGLASGDSSFQWNISLVARAWDSRVSPETEFRGIAWDGKLTCLCQYYHSLHFEGIVSDKDEIESDILACVADPNVQAAIRALRGHCIIDFARVAPCEVLIVELNPFDGVGLGTFPASTGLFLWDNEADKKIMKGEAPFEFRVRESPAPAHKLKNDCSKEWRKIVYGG